MKVLCVLFCAVLLSVPVARAADEKKPAAAAAKPINKTCPVEGGDVDPEVTVVHEGKTIGFCCAGCDTQFKKDPPKYMAIVAKEVKAADKKPATKPTTKPADKGKGKKKEAPKLNAKCPVTGDDVDPTLTTKYAGRTVAFCCEGCVDDFKKEPKKYMAVLEKQEKEAAREKDKGKKPAK